MKIFPLLMALLVSASAAFSHTALQGKVTDEKTGEPLIFGTVALFKNGVLITGAETDFDGFYFITEIDPGTYDVAFNYTGYAAMKITGVVVMAGQMNALDAKMTAGLELAEVCVTYSRPVIEMDRTSCGMTLTSEEIRRLPKRKPRAIDGMASGMTGKEKRGDTPAPGSSPSAKTAAPPPPPGIAAGTLTAGEVHDFSKWDLWQDIAAIDLERWRKHWQIHPAERYTVQAMTGAGQPIVGAEVVLFSGENEPVWTALTDNTGRAEMWANAFAPKESSRAEGDEKENLRAEVRHAGQVRSIDQLSVFQNGINTVKFDAPCAQPDEVDILFVVDATGSMGDEIEFLKVELADVIGQAQAALPDLRLNLGSVFYRDVRDEYLTRTADFSTNIPQTTDFIKSQSADGGGDGPEAVEVALRTALHEMKWSSSARARLLFLVLDAPPHHTPEIIAELQTLSREAAARGIRIIPVAGSGIDKSTEYLARSLALLTNGTYTFLTDHSGVGGGHIEPTSDAYEVEKMNDLLARIIRQFAEMPACEEAVVGSGSQKPESPADKKLVKKLGLRAFPNPSPGPLTVKLKMDVDELFVTDLTGKILHRFADLPQGETPVDLSHLPNGCYFLRVEMEGEVVTERVVVLH